MGFLRNWLNTGRAKSIVEAASRSKYPDLPPSVVVPYRNSDPGMFQYTYLVLHRAGEGVQAKVSWWSIGSPEFVAVEVDAPDDWTD